MRKLDAVEAAAARVRLDAFVKDRLGGYRPWSSKVIARIPLPYPIAAVLLFGWPVIALPVLELLVDWPALLAFREGPVLLAYLVTSSILASFPPVFTTLLYTWERRTFQPMITNLFFLLDVDVLARVRINFQGAVPDEPCQRQDVVDKALSNYEDIMLLKSRANVRLSNSKLLAMASLLIAGGYIYATILNTGLPLLLHYIPYFFLLFYCVDIIIGSIPHVFLMRRILEAFHDKLVIFPAHPDELGGLGPLKELAIDTTIVVATTALVIPWLLSIPLILAESLQYLSTLALAIVPLLVWLILSAFFYPTYILYRSISTAKDETLDRLYEEYSVAFARFQDIVKAKYHLDNVPLENAGLDPASATDVQDLATYTQRLKEDYKDVMGMKSWPVSAPVAWKLLASAIVPFLMPLVNWLLNML